MVGKVLQVVFVEKVTNSQSEPKLSSTSSQVQVDHTIAGSLFFPQIRIYVALRAREQAFHGREPFPVVEAQAEPGVKWRYLG